MYAPVERIGLIEIREGSPEDIVALYPAILELVDAHGIAEYEKRLLNAPKHLLLVTFDAEKAVGFKAGYERDSDGSFYSWMGGVARTHRRCGIARQLAQRMEYWAKAQGYTSIRLKTCNSHKLMLVFALNNRFNILGVEPRETIGEYRITLEKKL